MKNDKLTRKCPDCNTTMDYKNKYNYRNALKYNTKCKMCCCIGKNKGKVRSNETIIKIRESTKGLGRTGKYVSCTNCGTNTYKPQWELKQKKKFFCNRKCLSEYQTIPRVICECSLDGCDIKFERELRQIGNIMYCGVKCASKAGLLKIQTNPPKNRRTKPESEFMELLEKNNIKFQFQKSVKWINGWKKWYDFYIPKHNLLVEIDGIYWHGKGKSYDTLNKQQKKTRENDILKNKLAEEHGYNLIRIWSDEISNFKIEKYE